MMTKIVMYSLLPIALGAVSPTDLLLRKRQLADEGVLDILEGIKAKIKGYATGLGIPKTLTDSIVNQLNIPEVILENLKDREEIIKYLRDALSIPASCLEFVAEDAETPSSAEVTGCAKDVLSTALSRGPLVEALVHENNKSYALVLQVASVLNFGVFIFPSIVRGIPLGKTLSRWFLWVGEALSDLATFVWTWIAVYLGGNFQVYYLSLAIVSMVVAILKRVVSFIPFLSGIANSFVFGPLAFWIKLITVVITQYVPLYLYLDVKSTVTSFLPVDPVESSKDSK